MLIAALRLVPCCLCLSAMGGLATAGEAVFEGLDPLQWARAPHARLSHTVTMAAVALTAPGGVEYRFRCSAGGAPDSEWQAGTEYAATGLKPETEYTFVAEARDRATRQPLRAPASPMVVTTRKADRFDQTVSDEIELVPIMVNGDQDNRINIVVVNRWRKGEADPYNRAELRQTFLDDVRNAVEPALAARGKETQQPLATQRSFLNVYALWWPSVPPWDPEAYDRGEWAAHWALYNELRARLFLPWRREGRGWVTHLAMINSRGGGGGAGLLLDQRVGDAMIEGNAIEPFFHEFAHTAPQLGDVYVGWGCWGRADESSNTTLVFERDKIKWGAWIDPDTPVPTPYNRQYLRSIGLFEGGTHRPAYIFRATPVCTMGVNQFATHICPVCIQQAAQRTYDFVDPIENPLPAREELTLREPGRARFSIDRVQPVPDTQQVQWRLNGALIAEGTDAVEVDLGAIGAYELVCSLVDRTPLIREDPPFARFPRAERRWKVSNPKPLSRAAPLRVALKPRNPSCRGANDGAVAAKVSGGKPPYAYLWSGGSLEPAIRGLDAGAYSLRVVDSEFSHAEAECVLERPSTLVVDPRSRLIDGRWRVALAVSGDDPANLTCRWSTGARGLAVAGLADGKYRYRLTHVSGVTIDGEVTLAEPAAPLEVNVQAAIPSTGENNGQIRLDIRGGREPYRIEWADKPKERDGERCFLPPGRYEVVVKDANLTAVERTVAIGDEPSFVLERPAFAVSPTGGVQSADPQPGYRYLWYAENWPAYILRPPRGVYEGTFTAQDGKVHEAQGAVIPNTDGKWANPEYTDGQNSRAKNDYGSWVRLDAYVAGRRALPLTVKLETNHRGDPGARLEVFGETKRAATAAEILGEGKWQGVVDGGRLTVEGEGPDAGRFDLLYTARHEHMSRPLYVGNDFHPPKAGNYYLAAQREDTGAISQNRVGVAVTMGAPRAAAAPVRPDEVKSSKLLLWLDATDVDGDGEEDRPPWERGSLLGWQGKPGAFSSGGLVIYEPNVLNGRPVASWQYIWLQSLQEEVRGFQTICMVYKDHELSAEGTGPWEAVDAYLWDLRGKDDLRKRIPPEFLSGTAWLDGTRIDPYATPAPLDFHVVTFELTGPSSRAISRTHTLWEGAVAEFLAYDGKLSESERMGVEEHLRRKWLSEVHLPPASGDAAPRSAVRPRLPLRDW
jgi:hypothetical protein